MTDLGFVLLMEPEEAVLLAVDAAVPERVRDELRAWARADIDGPDGSRSLDPVLSLDGLLIAASTGVVGSAAWSVFPAAAHWLSAHVRSEHAPTLEDVAERMRECLAKLESTPSGDFVFAKLHQDHDGRWLGELRRGAVRYRITSDAAGHILRIRRDDEPG